eukprot:scaffold1352_cov144-Cylindrotheca_fusiformis.AAC.16
MINNDDSSKKRPRSVSPTPPNRPKPKSLSTNGETLSKRLMDRLMRTAALNELIQVTAKHENNYALDDDHVLGGLTYVFFDCIGWEPIDKFENASFQSQNAWNGHATTEAKDFAFFCKKMLRSGNLSSDNRHYLEAILVIFRNLSFVAANLRLLAYSPSVLQVLTGCLYEGSAGKSFGSGDDYSASSSNSSTLALPALHVLVNLAPYLDVTGQKLLCDKLFYAVGTSDEAPMVPSPETFGKAAGGSWGFGSLWLAKRFDTKEDLVQDISPKLLRMLTEDHLVGVWSIFPALAHVLTDSTASRLVIMMTVDLLQEFINHARAGLVGSVEDQEESSEIPSTRAILVHIPNAVLGRLADLLYIPRLGPDSLEYVDPVHNIVTRVTTLKLLMGYDMTIDTDLRDRALDVLVPLMELDTPRMARRLGADKGSSGKIHSRLYDAIFPILSSTAGRNEAPLMATQLLLELSKAKENKRGCILLQERILELASKDARVAQLAFNHLQPHWE